jgi:hypothetical protein
MSNAKIQIPNQTPIPNAKPREWLPALIQEAGFVLQTLELDIHLGKSILFSPGI